MTTPPGTGDTIVALSSAAGPGGRALLRLSGPDAVRIAAALAPGLPVRGRQEPPRVCALALQVPGGARVPCTATVHRAPRSYTREDIVEIHLPGSPALARAALEAACSAGARPAAGGEFTLRAFLNGRLDLARAEAVAGVIAAENADSARAALRAHQGRLSAALGQIESHLLDACAQLEGAIDFADQDIDVLSPADVGAGLERARLAVSDLRSECRASPAAPTIPRATLVGHPNAGKTTLFNALTGRHAAIASPEAGTTRDLLRAEIRIGGVAVELWDSPGLQDGREALPRRLNSRTVDHVAGADLAILVADVTRLDETAAWRGVVPEGVPVVGVVNKADLADDGLVAEAGRRLGIEPTVAVSALRGRGLDDLKAVMVRTLGLGPEAAPARPTSNCLWASTRQKERLEAVERALARAIEGIQERGADLLELTAEDVRVAIRAIGELTGRDVSDAVLARIFERFCVGK